MTNGLFTGIKKIIEIRAAYVEHVQFVEKAVHAQYEERSKMLIKYVQSLSDVGLIGFKATLMMAFKNEKDAARQQIIKNIFDCLDSVRKGDVDALSKSKYDTHEILEDDKAFLDDVNFVESLKRNVAKDKRSSALVDLFMKINHKRYNQFIINVEKGRDNVAKEIKDLELNEHKFGRRFIEDQIFYMSLRERGYRDPKFMETVREYEEILSFYDWVIEMAPRVWQIIQQPQAAAQAV